MSPLLDTEIGLLIGYNCSRALIPRQIVTGKDSEPYAVRKLIWDGVFSSLSLCQSDGIPLI